MNRSFLNLAGKPFVNTRPVVRLSIVLWVIGGLLLAGNVWLYWDFLAGRGDTYARLQEVQREIASTRERIDAMESELAGFDLEEQNLQVEYVNERIERRRFSWSRLFDALAAILPDDVRLTQLSPRPPEEREESLARRRRARSSSDDGASEDEEERFTLQIDAIARDDGSILALVDAMFADPAFERPNLLQQTRQSDGLIHFDLETIYRPEEPGDEGDGARQAGQPGAGSSGAEEPGEVRTGTAQGAGPSPAGPSGLGAPASSPPEVR